MKEQSCHKESLAEKVHHNLRLDVISGRIAGGTRLVESVLAEELGVSRTPVREALKRLTSEGLVYAIPRAGYIVEEMNSLDIQDLFEARMHIEQVVAVMAMERITSDELDRLERLLIRSDEVTKGGERDRMIELDSAFHTMICKAARNKSMLRIYQTLTDYSLKYRIALSLEEGLGQQSSRHHCRIFKALQAKDAAEMETAIREHAKEACDHIMDVMVRLRGASL